MATGRSGGVSRVPFDSLNLATHVGDDPVAVTGNRDRVAEWAGCAPGQWAMLAAVHGAAVAQVDGPGEICDADIAVTTGTGLAIAALGADCVTVGLACGAAIGVVHVGWTGLVVGAVDAGVTAVRAAGGSTHVVAVLGPSICGTCYPVPRERADHVADSCGVTVARAALLTCPDGQPGIDVAAGVVTQLAERDVVVAVRDERCTAQDPQLFSHRRDGRDRPTGRQGLAMALVADDAVRA